MPPSPLEDPPDLKEFHRRTQQNLLILQEREVKYSGNAPLDLLNQIEDHQTALALTEQALTGEISEEAWPRPSSR